jgi:hypothetical protein
VNRIPAEKPCPAKARMTQEKPSGLNARMMNCLQTILDLESALCRLELGYVLLSEFKVLKDFLREMDGVTLDEADVKRIELATAHFLEEIRAPLSMIKENNDKKVILQ